jgi:hypothetical protein
VSKVQRPYVRLNEDYIQSQTQSLSAQITDLQNRLIAVRATTHDVDQDRAARDRAARGTAGHDFAVDAVPLDPAAVGTAPVATAIQLMTLIRERKQYLNEFSMATHGHVRRPTTPDERRRQYRRIYF